MALLRFIYVRNMISRTVNGTFQELSFAVRVRNLGFGKRVAIHWCGEDGNWRESPADFRCALDGGDEVWVADLALPLTIETSIPGNIRFAACLEHGGSGTGQPPRPQLSIDADSGVIVFEPVDVRVTGCRPHLPAAMVSLRWKWRCARQSTRNR
jgi:maltose 6'-phosphate phosphatase